MIYRSLFYLLLITAPLFLGSERRIFWGINACLTALALAAFTASEWGNRRFSRFDWRPLLVACGALAVSIVWMAIQATTWTPEFLHHPIWKTVAQDLPGVSGAISIDPPLTWVALAWTAALAIIVVAARVGTSQAKLPFAMSLMVWVILGVAVFGILVEVLNLETVGLLPKTAYKGWVTGTFVNRNTAASFFGLGMIMALSMATEWRGVPPGNRQRVMTLVVIVLLSAVAMTGSRAGVAAAVVGALAVVAFRVVERRRRSESYLHLGLLLAGLCVVSAAAVWWVFAARENVADSFGLRLALHAETIRMIVDRPLLGHGAGAFQAVEPLYHSPAVDSAFVWADAHSTWLEAFASLGIPVTVALIAMIGYVIARLFSAWRNSGEEVTAIVAALSGAIALGLHAFVNFSLENQAVAIYFVSLLGLAIGQRMRLGRSP